MTESRTFDDETPELAAAVPAHLLDALRRYGHDREPVGGFLAECLANNLCEAVCRADPESLEAIKGIVLYIHNAMPSTCHGSREAVRAWVGGSEVDPRFPP
jgi:hypothetical protein